MTDNPIRRLVGDYARRLVPDGFTPSADFLDRAIIDAVQENEMTEQSMTAVEAEEEIVSEYRVCAGYGMNDEDEAEVEARENIAAIRADERAKTDAELNRMTNAAQLWNRQLKLTLDDVAKAVGRPDLINEDGDGDWSTVFELLAELRPRAEAAEAALNTEHPEDQEG